MFQLFHKNEDGTTNPKAFKWILLIGAAVGVLLLLLGGKSPTVEKAAENTIYVPKEDELVIYQEYLEERVETICRSVRGVGSVTAIVSLEGGFHSEYATELKDGDEQYVILGNGSSAQALFLSRNAPDIAGIGVVCQGAENATVREELIELLSATFRVPSNRIHITQAK